MIGNQYFKSAAAQIRRGIDVTKQEIQKRRHDIERMKQDTGKQINNIQNQIRTLEADLTRQRNDSTDQGPSRAQELRIIIDRQNEITNKQKILLSQQDKLLVEIRDEERQLTDLEQQARHLEAFGT